MGGNKQHRSLEFSGKAVCKAGDMLAVQGVEKQDPEGFDQAMNVLSYWRSCHEVPLQCALDFLQTSAEKLHLKAVFAKRLKRAPSIVNKLRRIKGMTLRNMQDIGGCRAILSDEKRVRKLVRELKKRCELRVKDYIRKPKADGYRSIHLIGRFSDIHSEPRQIELQVRTQAQHSWATAVEIIDLFTGQAIKASQGDLDWKRFFKCAAIQLALIEEIPLYNKLSVDKLSGEIYNRLRFPTPASQRDALKNVAQELYVLSSRLDVLDKFNAYANSLKAADDHLSESPSEGYILLQIDIENAKIQSTIFPKEKFDDSAKHYLAAEKEAAIKKLLVVALVSTDAVGGIKEAYPNYFADSTIFTRYISASIEAYKRYIPVAMRVFQKIVG